MSVTKDKGRFKELKEALGLHYCKGWSALVDAARTTNDERQEAQEQLAELQPLIEALESIEHFAERGDGGTADEAQAALGLVRQHAQAALKRAKGEQ